VLGRQLRNRLVALDRLKRDLGFGTQPKTVSASSWWVILLVIGSTLTPCLRNRHHLYYHPLIKRNLAVKWLREQEARGNVK
jgi:hypothetical protein